MIGTRDELIKKLMDQYQPDDFMLLDIWTPTDIIKYGDIKISFEQAIQVLQSIDNKLESIKQ
jgi:hypothetical protein